MIGKLYSFWNVLYNGMQKVFDYMSRDVDIWIFEGPVYELVLGAGLVAIIGYIIFNWIV